MDRPLRIAYGRICQETNAFSPVPSTLEDFRRLHWLEGAELAAACKPLRYEVDGLCRNGELSGFVRAARRFKGRRVEALPLFSAWAAPSGPLSDEAYQSLREKLQAELRAAGPLDGVFFALHGAMRGMAMQEPEEGFLAAIREVVGPDVPVAITLDLHGNLTPGKVDQATIIAAYRTNPHRDLARTGFRAGTILLQAAAGQVRPSVAWRSLPLVLGGGTTVDLLPPMRGIFRRMKAMERDPRVLYASLFMCHLWNDSPDLGWSVHVVTDGDSALADQLADELAERAWEVRHQQPPPFLTASEAIAETRQARLARRTGTVCFSDTSDNVGAGGVGESTWLLKALQEEGQGLLAYLPVRDAEAVADLWDAAPGSPLQRTIGGRLAPDHSPPIEVRGTVLARAETSYSGRAVAIACGDLRVVLTENAPVTLRPAFYKTLGLNPWKADLVVVKSLFHYRVHFFPVARKNLYVRTQGTTDLDLIKNIAFNAPVHPLAEVADWRPVDRARRGLVVSAS